MYVREEEIGSDRNHIDNVFSVLEECVGNMALEESLNSIACTHS